MAKLREPGENPGRLRHCYGLQTSIATGSARGIGKAGERFEARSQDTNLAVLVRVVEFFQQPTSPTKRRMRPALLNCFQRDSLNAFIPVLSESKVFYFKSSIPHWSLNPKPVLRNIFAKQIERSVT